MTEPVVDPPAEPLAQTAGPDPSNTPIEELTAPLDPNDDVHERIALVNTSTADDLRGHTA